MRRLALLLPLLILVGCHHHARPNGETMIVGFAAPEYAGKRIKHILVNARTGNLYFRDQLERRMVAKIEDVSGYQTQGVTYIDMFPPIRDYSPKEIDEQIARAGVDAVMFINAGSDVQTASGWGFSVGNGGGSGGSYTKAARFTNTTVEVYDPKSKKIMWKAEGDLQVRGGSQKSMDDTASNLAYSIAGMLRRDGFCQNLTADAPKGR